MIDQLLEFIAPHHCSNCSNRGCLLCDNCKYDIISEPFGGCLACGKAIARANGICSSCTVPYQRAWCIADRRDGLERLIDSYKFHNAKAAHIPLAELLHAQLPELPVTTVIVPIPTVSSHIRQRGYDHTLLIAKKFGKLRGLPVSTKLQRITSTKQRNAGRAQRISQAKTAFRCSGELDNASIYLLIDDVVTTGATMKYAAKSLQDAGARQVWVVSISRQLLEENAGSKKDQV